MEALKTEPARGYIAKLDQLAWLIRHESGHAIDIACLRVGQRGSCTCRASCSSSTGCQAMRPDLNVAMAAYGEYAPGYIGTAAAYIEGGYETSSGASNVAPEATKSSPRPSRSSSATRPQTPRRVSNAADPDRQCIADPPAILRNPARGIT